MTIAETRPIDVDPLQFAPRTEPIGSDLLAQGFREYNRGLQVPVEYQERVDDILDYQAREIAPELADHGRRVGGYAGAILKCLEHPIYSDGFHEGLIRIDGAIHDFGKGFISRDVLFRSLGYVGAGTFSWDNDGEEMMDHTIKGWLKVQEHPEALPPEARYAMGCHHQYADSHREPYGVELSVIDRENSHNPGMADWVHFMVKVINMADYWDASTTRENNYFSSNKDRRHRIYERAQMLFPHKANQILDALYKERDHYFPKIEVTPNLVPVDTSVMLGEHAPVAQLD